MPPTIGKYTVSAKNEPLSLVERVTPSKAIREKYSKPFTPRRQSKPKVERPHIRPLTVEERKQLLAEAELEKAEKTLLSQLVLARRKLDKKSLLERISVPLELRLSDPSRHPEYEYKPVNLEGLHFVKDAYLQRLEEVHPMFEAALIRLEPLFKKLNLEDSREDQGLPTRVPANVREKLWVMYNDLHAVYDAYDTKGRTWYNKKWRRLIGALKRIGKVSFERLDERLPEICDKLVELNLTFHDL